MTDYAVRSTYKRIESIRSTSDAIAALRALDRDLMMLVIGYGLAQPEHGGYWAIMLDVIARA